MGCRDLWWAEGGWHLLCPISMCLLNSLSVPLETRFEPALGRMGPSLSLRKWIMIGFNHLFGFLLLFCQWLVKGQCDSGLTKQKYRKVNWERLPNRKTQVYARKPFVPSTALTLPQQPSCPTGKGPEGSRRSQPWALTLFALLSQCQPPPVQGQLHEKTLAYLHYCWSTVLLFIAQKQSYYINSPSLFSLKNV